MFKTIFLMIVGFILLIYGADLLVKGSGNIAKKLKMSDILIGLTIVAIGTSLPELIITIISSAKGTTDLIIGNVLGSNICNILLILGIMSIIKPVKTDRGTRKIHIPVLIISTILVLFMGLGIFSDEKLVITRKDGIILILFGVLYYLYIIVEKNKKETFTDNADQNINIYLSLINILLGSILLKYGGDFVVEAATRNCIIIKYKPKSNWFNFNSIWNLFARINNINNSYYKK